MCTRPAVGPGPPGPRDAVLRSCFGPECNSHAALDTGLHGSPRAASIQGHRRTSASATSAGSFTARKMVVTRSMSGSTSDSCVSGRLLRPPPPAVGVPGAEPPPLAAACTQRDGGGRRAARGGLYLVAWSRALSLASSESALGPCTNGLISMPWRCRRPSPDALPAGCPASAAPQCPASAARTAAAGRQAARTLPTRCPLSTAREGRADGPIGWTLRPQCHLHGKTGSMAGSWACLQSGSAPLPPG